MAKDPSMFARRQRGVSLIELMVALTIALLLSIGIVQIFGASRATYQMQDGLSRVQESGRYAMQHIQRQLRMVGYMGCGGDLERMRQGSFVNHLATYSATVPGGDVVAKPEYRFQRPLEAYAKADLPGDIKETITGVLDGTDILVLRTISEDAVPVLSISRASGSAVLNLTAAAEAATVFASAAGGDVAYALQNCRSADVFVGKLTAATSVLSVNGKGSPNVYLDPSVSDCGGGGCPWDFRISNVFLNAALSKVGADPAAGERQLNGELHRAEYTLLYIRPNPNLIPSLYMRQFARNGIGLADAEELAEGIENLQLRFGVDTNGDGQVDAYKTGKEVANGATATALDANWRNVLSVRVGLLIRSPENAGVPGTVAGAPRTYKVLGTTITPANDGTMRQVYETTVALRNRIINS